MNFLIDQNLPAALAAWIRERGHGAAHVRDIGMAEAGDRAVLAEARSRGAVLVSKDADFARGEGAQAGPAVIWVRVGNTVNDRFFVRWAAVWPGLLAALEDGEMLVEMTAED